jgi:dihydroorotase
MNILIQNGRVIDPASGFDHVADVAVADGHIVAIAKAGEKLPANFKAEQTIDAKGCIVAPGLVDLQVRLREPGYEHEGMLASELTAAVAGGVTSLVCPPDTDPVLDEPGLIEMLKFRAEKLHRARVFPLGALTRGLKGEVLTEMSDLTDAGCVGFSQAEVPLENTQVLQYAATFGYTVWLRPQEMHLGKGVAASGPLATRLGLGGVPVAAETIALHTIFALMRSTKARVHLCRISSAEGVELVRAAKKEGLAVTADVSINSLHLSDHDIGYFDSRARVTPVLRQQRDREALRSALADGTLDALVSDHTPIDNDGKALPFAEAESGATGIELLLSLSLKWAQDSKVSVLRALDVLTAQPAKMLGKVQGMQPDVNSSLGQLHVGGVADIVVFDPTVEWHVTPDALHSQGKHTPFAFDMTGMSLPARVKATLVAGRVAYQAM